MKNISKDKTENSCMTTQVQLVASCKPIKVNIAKKMVT